MSGHSKWATTRRQKEAADQKKGAVFTKLARAISVAAKQGGGDPAANFPLRLAIAKARAANMPKENIERTISSSTGGGEEASLEEVVYEAFGPGGSALVIEATTDNKNRLVSEVKFALSRNGGKLTESGTALRLFKRVGKILITTDKKDNTHESISLMLMDASPDDILDVEGGLMGVFPLERLGNAVSALDREGVHYSVEVMYLPHIKISVGEHAMDELAKLTLSLKNIEDVNGVYSNAV